MKEVALLVVLAAAGVLIVRKLANRDDEDDQGADVEDFANQAVDYAEQLTDNVDDYTVQKNVDAFLKALRVGEGTSDSSGYFRLFGGGNFAGTSTHPALNGWPGVKLSPGIAAAAGYPNGAVSTAAGAYQINKPTWLRLQSKYGFEDFAQASQDKAALQLIAEKGATADVQAGRVQDAVNKVRKIWASLPGAGYGQGEVSMQAFLNNYEKYGGVIANG